MLSTLLKIGTWQSQDKGEWDRFLDRLKIDRSDRKGNQITNHVLPIIFDLDEMKVVIEPKNLKEYDESLIESLKVLKVQGGNNKSIYTAVSSTKLIQLYKTFFGKENKNVSEGELMEAVRNENANLLTSEFEGLLSKIFSLREQFLQRATRTNEKKGTTGVSFDAISEALALGKNDRVALVFVQIKDSNLGFKTPTPFSDIPEYVDFLKEKFLGAGEASVDGGIERLCYASGRVHADVDELDLPSRYSLNKMFVTETRNYATQFDKNSFRLNYQVSKLNQERLDHASNYLLNEGAYRVRIANIDHLIVPQFPETSKLDLDMVMTGIKTRSDLLFSYNVLEDAVNNIRADLDSIFWLNFIAFESDGNFFKSTGIIKDVSSFHFEKVIAAFRNVSWDFRKADFVDWYGVMTEFGKKGVLFNLNTIYSLIPQRKEKEKTNRALGLFKAILENRKINRSDLFDYFGELTLCHYFERYSSYTNIPKSSKDYLGKTLRNSVFRYIAFIEVLKKLKMIDMKETMKTEIDESVSKYEKAIQSFFSKMQLDEDQQALFYLGRMLNAVERIQIKKMIKKTVINKVNFNGLEKDDIERLRKDLVDKAKQHGQMGKIIFNDRRFGELFDYNKWKEKPLDPNEALFFLLTGYSFGVNTKDATELEQVELED